MPDDTRKTIEAPGVYEMPAEEYHADPCPDPSLSASTAVDLVAKTPRHARLGHPRLNPEFVAENKREFDLGTAAHTLILEPEEARKRLVVIDAPTYQTKAAKEQRDDAYEKGLTPLLRAQFDEVERMVAAFNAHPWARDAFKNGKPEQSMFWRDEAFGIWCRCRPDFMPQGGAIFADYKTAANVHPDFLRRHLWDRGYVQRAAHYLDGFQALGLAEAPHYLFVFQEKTPPYDVVPVVLDGGALEWGRRLNRKAREMFAWGLRSGEWPGYTDDVLTIGLPHFIERQLEGRFEMGEFDVALDFQKPLDAAE